LGQFGKLEGGNFVPAGSAETTHYKVADIGSVALGDYAITVDRDDINVVEDPYLGWIFTYNDNVVTSRPAILTIWAITTLPNNERFCFTSLDNPGLCDVPATASTAVGWGIDPNGSQVNQIPPGLQPSVTLRLVGLPPNTGQFGSRLLWAVSPDGRSFDGRTVRIFFPKYAWNHPNQGNPQTPNWYFYWSQTSANYGTHRYNPNESRTGRTIFDQHLNTWVATIGSFAGVGPVDIVGWGSPTGIDLFAWTCRHEGTHLSDLQSWWGNNDRNDVDDPDRDFMPDWAEIVLGYDPFNPQTYEDTFHYGAGFNDTEHWCLITQPRWTNGAADGEDWAQPGKQWP